MMEKEAKGESKGKQKLATVRSCYCLWDWKDTINVTTAQHPGPPGGRWNPRPGPQREDCQNRERGNCPVSFPPAHSNLLPLPPIGWNCLETRKQEGLGNAVSCDTKWSWEWQGLDRADREDRHRFKQHTQVLNFLIKVHEIVENITDLTFLGETV